MINQATVRSAAVLVALFGLLAQSANLASYAGNGSFAQKHPRRAEVLGRDNRINGRLNRDYGKLGGHYGQLKQEDKSIKQQEQADAKANGGYITKSQKQQLNSEENSVNQQIKQDYQ